MTIVDNQRKIAPLLACACRKGKEYKNFRIRKFKDPKTSDIGRLPNSEFARTAIDGWILQLNSTFLELVLGKQTKYLNNIIIKHKYSNDFMTKLAKKKYLRKDFVINF